MFGGGFLLVLYVFLPDQEYIKQEELRSKRTQEGTGFQAIGHDSDNDGLKDWEEALFGTNPENPDSDEDGMLDGKEVESARDPLVSGAGDIFETQELKRQDAEATLTESLTKRLFQFYLASQKSGTRVPRQANQEVSTTIQTEIESKGSLWSNTYRKEELLITGSSNDELHEYGNRVIQTIQKHPKATVSEVSKALESSFTENDVEGNTVLLASQEYETLGEDLLSIPVPLLLSDLHLKAINEIKRAARAVRDMRFIVGDPLRALVALQIYRDSQNNTFLAFQAIKRHFEENNVIFEAEEPGTAWDNF